MGAGNYRGSIPEVIMFFATKDYAIDIDVKDYYKDGDTAVLPYSWNGIKLEHRTNHFNINSIVDDMVKKISTTADETFKYKFDSHNPLRNDAFSVFNEKFGHCDWSIRETWYNPSKDEYTLDITLQGKKLDYIHKGNIHIGHTRKIGMFFMKNYPEYII